MKIAWIALAGATLLGSCASDAPFPPSGPLPPPPPVYAPPPPAYTPAPQPVRDQCGAAALQGLIGKPRTEIPVPVLPGARRVYCTTCPATQDFQPGRLNILYDEETGLVQQVKCG